MACASQALIAANSCSFPSQRAIRKSQRLFNQSASNLVCTVRASSEDSDCNVDECAPDKEVGPLSRCQTIRKPFGPIEFYLNLVTIG